jgi:hypothetical protein
LVTEEFSQSEPDAAQVKYYAPGIGNVKVTWKGEDTSREVLDLISLTQLDSDAMAEVRDAALELEQSALENSKEVYAASEPLVYSTDPASVAEFWDLDPANFPDPTNIDNVWMPMQPGTRWVHEGTAVDDEGNTFNRRIEFTVTDLTKEIGGVRTVVAWIVDYNADEVIEKEIAFYAQDKDGNVWYFGEYPEEYEDGEFVKASPWIHGIEDARAFPGLGPSRRLVGLCADRTNGTGNLCPYGLLHRCPCDRRIEPGRSRCVPTQDLCTECR